MSGRELAERIGAKAKEAQGLLDGLAAKGEGDGHEDLQKVKALNEEIRVLRGQLDGAREADAIRGEAAGNLAFVQAPANRPAFDGSGGLAGHSAQGAQALGFVPAGSARVTESEMALEIEQSGPEGFLLARQKRASATAEYGRAFLANIRKGFGRMDGASQKALLEGQDTAGGFVVPQQWLSEMIMKEPTPTRVRGQVRQLMTARDHLAIPKVVYSTDDLYTTGARVTWTGEVPATANTAQVSITPFGQVVIPIWTAMISIPLTNDLVEDAGFDLQSWVAQVFDQTIDLLYDNMILNGTGVGQPAGILVNPGATNNPAVVVSGSASALTADGMVSVAGTLPEQYLANAKWVMNYTSTVQALRKLKDSQNRYLFGMGYQDSGLMPPMVPERILGFPAILSGFMPNVGASTYPIVFGDLSSYFLVNRVGFSIQVLREISAKSNQIELLGRIRFGGLVAKDWALKIHQCHT